MNCALMEKNKEFFCLYPQKLRSNFCGYKQMIWDNPKIQRRLA
jgi:hypothetical protein